MKNMKAVQTTEAERAAIEAAIGAVRGAIGRFKEENKGIVGYAPTALVQIQELEHFFRLTLPGRPAAIGRTLDEAFEDLAEPQDAAFKRNRAIMLRAAADQLEREAGEMEGSGKGGAE